MQDKVLLIDGLNFIYRGVVKFEKKLNNPTAFDYTIVYQLFRNLRALIEEFKPNRCFFVQEGNPLFRKKLLPEYKQNRLVKRSSVNQDEYNDFLKQTEIIYSLLSYLPITIVKAFEYEADDAIYTLASNLKEEEVVIVSTDSDLIQIIQLFTQIKLYNPVAKEFISPPDYVYLVWKSLAGDKSDNVPGIISPSKAENLARTPQDLKEFLSIEENRANFSLNKQVIELQYVPENKLIMTYPEVNLDVLFESFEKFDFKSMLKASYRDKFYSTFANLK